ncbi:MAG: hypothetical protein V3V10_04440, partial [Planctomycetota bacterium]
MSSMFSGLFKHPVSQPHLVPWFAAILLISLTSDSLEAFLSDRAKLKSAVLCDGAMRVGRKWTLQGVFDGIWSQNFPSNPISFWI